MAQKDSSLLKKMKALKDTQLDIQGLSTWCLSKGGAKAGKIISTWQKAMKEVVKPKQRLVLFYLANDIIQNAKRKKVKQYVDGWKKVLPAALRLVASDPGTKDKVSRVLNIWGERHIFDKAFLDSLAKGLEESKPAENGGGSAEDDGFSVSEFLEQTDKLIVISEDVELYRKRYDDYSVKLSEEYIEEMKNKYKDLPPGCEEVKKFHKAVAHLRNYCTTLKKQRSEELKMLKMAMHALVYYSGQRKDAKVVTKAYHNFGERVKSLQRRVDEKIKILPEASPVPSPDLDAPSPQASDDGSSTVAISDDDIRVEEVKIKAPSSATLSFMGDGDKMQKILQAIKSGSSSKNNKSEEKRSSESSPRKRSDKERDKGKRRSRSRSRDRERDRSSRSKDRRSRSRERSRRSSSRKSKKHKDRKRGSSRSSPLPSSSPSRALPPPLDIPLPPSPGRSSAAAAATRTEPTITIAPLAPTSFNFYGTSLTSAPPLTAVPPDMLPPVIPVTPVADYRSMERPRTEFPTPNAYFSAPPPPVPQFSVPPVVPTPANPVSTPTPTVSFAEKAVKDSVFVTPETGSNAWNFSAVPKKQGSWTSSQSSWMRSSNDSSDPEVELIEVPAVEERVPAITSTINSTHEAEADSTAAWRTQLPSEPSSWSGDVPAWHTAQSRQNSNDSDWYNKYNGGDDVEVIEEKNGDDLDFVGAFEESVIEVDDNPVQGNNGDDLYSDLEFSAGRNERATNAATSFNNLISLTSEGSDEPRKDFSWMQGSNPTGDTDMRTNLPPMLSQNPSSYRQMKPDHSVQGSYQTFGYRPRANVWRGGGAVGGGGGAVWRNNRGAWRPRGPRTPGRVWRGYSTS